MDAAFWWWWVDDFVVGVAAYFLSVVVVSAFVGVVGEVFLEEVRFGGRVVPFFAFLSRSVG